MRGFTLIELLLAVAVIALGASLVSLSVRGDERRKVQDETARLAALFRMAQSEARISGRTLVWEADSSGYAFRPLRADQAGLRDELQRRRSWPFQVDHVATPAVLFAREPLREPALVELVLRERDLRLALDALGNLAAVDCGATRCAASR